MEIRVNLALCALVFLTCCPHIRGQNTTVPHISTPSVIAAPATVAPIPSNSSHPNGPADAPIPQNTTANSSSNGTVTLSPVITPPPTPQDNKATPNQTATDLPVTTASVRPSASANGTNSGELNSTSGASTQPTTNRPLPVNTTATTSVAHSSTHPPTLLPSNVSIQPTTTTTTTTSSPATSSTAPTKPHQDTPSELNVGDEDVPSVSHNPGAHLDPLLAGLVSVFIVSAAIVSLLLFLKFRKRNDGPEFRRLQDLPMDDMMEDTPLSMFSY
ncbi:hypothetical protein SKAU_G00069040 [Synaphobranchus kaupii]|uniref:Uncharacterized protein n=1 Tax=Synaphobranchus kaupii TaxID=118154 RepID=A0A9Q1G6D8_SYNKA|nr:hypothetical protein SKAU_G00069040 [Synaphobranchus kaupii]